MIIKQRDQWPNKSPEPTAVGSVSSAVAGTPSSMAALIVHRPSSESETRPANFARVEFFANA